MDDEKTLKSRIKDLAMKAYKQNIYMYTFFLTPAELGVFYGMRGELDYIDYECYDRDELCERRMIRFGSYDMFGYEEEWPIKIVSAKPLIDKFSDELSHRDYLGAIMNLGIDRSVVGDIFVKDSKRAYIFCQDKIAEYIADNLKKIKHTNVSCSILDAQADVPELKPTLIDVNVIVASARFDAIAAALTKLSRSEILNYFKAGKVFLGGRLETRNSLQLKDGDIFSIRGYGKYMYCGEVKTTKKGRCCVSVKQYK